MLVIQLRESTAQVTIVGHIKVSPIECHIPSGSGTRATWPIANFYVDPIHLDIGAVLRRELTFVEYKVIVSIW